MMSLPTVRSDIVFHQHVGWTVGGVWVLGGLLVRKCWTGVWISFPGLFPCESEAQCLPSETWLRFRPDGLVRHLREPHRPRAQLAPSPLSSHPLHFLFSPSILSFIQTQSPPPLFPFPFISCCLPLWVSYFPPLALPSPLPMSLITPLPAQPYFSFLPLCPPCVSCLSSFFTLCSKVSERRKGYEEKPDHSGRGILAQPLFLTLGPSAQFICLRRH